MGNEGLKVDNIQTPSERRQVCICVPHDRRGGHDRRCEKRSSFMQKIQEEKGLVYALEALPPVRRLVALPDKIEDGDLTSALGMAGLAFINLPEDLQDIKSAIGQIRSFSKGSKYVGAYNYRDCQSEFSFLKGTLIDRLVDFSKAHKHPEVKRVLEIDKPLIRTGFGSGVLSLLGVGFGKKEPIKSFNAKTNTWEVAKDYKGNIRYANSFKGSSAFGRLTARALSRTTLLGSVIIAALELPKIFKSASKGKNPLERGESTAEQVVKSSINVASTTAGIAYGGAIGSKYGKSFGSLIGMGIGAIIGSTISKEIQDNI